MHKTYSAEDDEYVKNQKVRLEARKAFLETVSLRRLALLELRRTREKTEWTTGQLCYWWTEKAKGAVKHPGGVWAGPATVIAQEPGSDGHPGSVVWIEHHGRLLRAGRGHLRPATEMELEMHQLLHGEAVPLNITAAMLKVKGKEFEDLIGQKTPDLDDEDDAWAVEPEDPLPPAATAGGPEPAEPT